MNALKVKNCKLTNREAQEYKILFKIDRDGNLDPRDVKLLQKENNSFVEVPYLKALSLTVHRDYVDFHIDQRRMVESTWR